MVNEEKKMISDIRLVEQCKGKNFTGLYRAQVCSPENIWAMITFFCKSQVLFLLAKV